jgi:NAD(P)-dependent dehydrogenase (short-subunit alcohol dehydrogenase family)
VPKQRVAVVGATGGIGTAIVAAALAAGHKVVACARDERALEALAQQHGSGVTALPGSVATEAQAAALAEEIRGLRARPDAVVVAIAAPLASGRLLERTPAALMESVAQDVLPHFLAARHLLPLLAERSRGGTWVALGCAAADHPWAGYGHVSIGAAARKMLLQVLREECKDWPVRILLAQIERQVCTHRNVRTACPAWANADDVGRQVVSLLERPGAACGIVHLRAGGAPVSSGGEKS